jgi:uncharacterized RDD family membrane protein YckC
MSNDPIPPSDSTLQGQYAGFVSRFSALIVDILLIMVTLIVVGLVLRLILQFFHLDDFFSYVVDTRIEQHVFLDNFLRIFAVLGSFYFIFFIYYITLHTVAAGLTIGKALIGLRVVRMDGTPLTFGRSTRRYITFWLSALALFLGLLWVIIDDRRQGWHDKLSDTCVIYDWPAQEDENFLSRLKYRIRYAQETRSRYGIDSDSDSEEPVEQPELAASDSLT